MAGQSAFVPLVLFGVVGVFLTYFAYEITGILLALVGYAVGAGAGFFAGLVLQSNSTGDAQLLLLVGIVGGAILGRLVVPILGQLAVGVLGFVATSVATLAFLTSGRVQEAIRVALPTTDVQVPLNRLVEYVLADPSLQGQSFQQTMLVVVGVGVVGGLIAMAYYKAVMSLVLTGVGATLLAISGPVLLYVMNHSGPTAIETIPSVSPLWFGGALVTGLGFQFLRHADDSAHTGR